MTEIPTRLVINCETGEREIIPLTAEEIAERDAMAAQALADQFERDAVATAKAEAKQSAIAKLSALGLTESEIAALTA
jgi:DNA-binding NarL/FixJ family response regulator